MKSKKKITIAVIVIIVVIIGIIIFNNMKSNDKSDLKVIKVNGMFCGIVLKPGTHNIKLNYTTPGLKIGTCISLISLIILIGIAIRSRKKLLKD